MLDMLYHGSPQGGLRLLRANRTPYFGKPRQVCLSSMLPMALLYCVRHFEYTYGYTKDGHIYYMEYFPDALAEIYAGKSASLYLCTPCVDFVQTEIPNEYASLAPVPVQSELVIPDVYEALRRQERMGALRIVRWGELTDMQKAWIEKKERQTILEKGLLNDDSAFSEYMREKYPGSWTRAQNDIDGGKEHE